MERPGLQNCDHLPRDGLLALLDQRAYRLVSRAQWRITRPRHLDRDNPAPRDAPCERDPAGRGGAHRRTGLGGEIDATVPPSIGTGRRFPPPYDRGAPLERPHALGAGPGVGSGGGGGGVRAAQQSEYGQGHRREQGPRPPGTARPTAPGSSRFRCVSHDRNRPVSGGSMGITDRICGLPAGCGHRRHPAPDGSRTLLVAIRVTGSTSHAPPPPSLRTVAALLGPLWHGASGRQARQQSCGRDNRAPQGVRPWPSSRCGSCWKAASTSVTRPVAGTRR